MSKHKQQLSHYHNTDVKISEVILTQLALLDYRGVHLKCQHKQNFSR